MTLSLESPCFGRKTSSSFDESGNPFGRGPANQPEVSLWTEGSSAPPPPLTSTPKSPAAEGIHPSSPKEPYLGASIKVLQHADSQESIGPVHAPTAEKLSCSPRWGLSASCKRCGIPWVHGSYAEKLRAEAVRQSQSASNRRRLKLARKSPVGLERTLASSIKRRSINSEASKNAGSNRFGRDPEFMGKLFGRRNSGLTTPQFVSRAHESWWRRLAIPIVDPLSYSRMVWELIVSMLIVWGAIEIPFSVSFLEQAAPLPTTYYLLPTTYYLLPTAYCLLPTTYHLLSTTYYVLRTTYYVLRTTYYILHTTYYVLRTTCYILRITYCILRTTYYVLHTAYYVLRTTYYVLLYCWVHTTYHVLHTTCCCTAGYILSTTYYIPRATVLLGTYRLYSTT